MQKEVSKMQQAANQLRYETLYKQGLYDVIHKADPRICKVLRSDSFDLKPFTELFGSCYLYGPAGTGKSVMAAFRLIELFRLRFLASMLPRTALFITCGELLLELKNTFAKASISSEMEIIQKYQQVDILVLDDIGVMSTTDWAYTQLYLIINYRYSHEKPTIYTSNLSLEALAKQLGDDRIPDRIRSECKNNIYFFNKQSRRG